MLKVAVIGLGGIGNNHCRQYKSNDKAELVAVCDINRERADKAAAQYGVPAFYSVDELLQNAI
jgi:predicted dehydrogenase